MDSSGHTSQTESLTSGLIKRGDKLYIKTAIQTPEGEFEYQANLSEGEVSFLLEYAINSLMQKGAIPFVEIDAPHKVAVQSAEKQ